MTQQEEQIEAARALLKPTPVKLHAVPDWFRRAMLKQFGRHYDSASGYGLLGHIQQDRQRWLDHFGTTVYRGKPAFVAEPYGLSVDDLKYIDWLANELACNFLVESNSWWFPGRTIRIVFYERDKANESEP